MNAREKALADQNPTFADLCDRVRTTSRARIRAKVAHERALGDLRRAEQADNEARAALDDLIARETKVEA
ncbi:hypothetical protein [uncultured Sphingomonas sp.]|uniref:hypothetical protein n=1 Tax=uncultured Sphingomonas sp. TaxID=158754 RepID=UPI0030DA0E3E